MQQQRCAFTHPGCPQRADAGPHRWPTFSALASSTSRSCTRSSHPRTARECGSECTRPFQNNFSLTRIPTSRVEFRPLEGFVLAVTPFNFTAIGGNLVFAPAVVGNVVIWKPSPAATYANYLTHKILLEAGMPPSVVQFVPVSVAGRCSRGDSR